MHLRLSRSSLIGLYLFIILAHFPITSGVADTDPDPVEMKEDTSTPKKICHTDIMAQCREKTSYTRDNNSKLVEENYLACLKDYFINDINSHSNRISTKSRKAFFTKINRLINHKKMFTLLYDDTTNPPNKEMVEKRIAKNRSRIAEELLTMFFDINYGCDNKDYIHPDEQLSDATLEELKQY